MKIAFDVQPLLNGTKTGVGFCEDGLVSTLLQIHPEHTYILEYFSLRHHKTKEDILKKYTEKKALLSPCKWFPGSLYRLASAYLPLPYCFLFRKRKHLTHFFNYYIPPFVRGKKVVTIHDMTMHAYPETVRKKTLWFLKQTLKKSIKRADHIITDSEFSKNEILKYYNVSKDKISVVYCGGDFERFKPLDSREALINVLKKYELPEKYFLYLGTLEPRKNLIRLIQAYAELQKEEPDLPCLVLAGGKGWMYDEIFRTVTELGLEQKILFTGYVEDDEVPVLMGGAYAFCFPSLYEGFGMPVLEAMACGTPVLTTAASSMEEFAGDTVVLIDALDVASIKAGLAGLYNNKEFREQLSQKGITKAKEYTWEKAVEQLLQVYQDIVKE